MIHVSSDFVVAVVVGCVVAVERYTPLLDRFKKKTPADAAGELDIADRKIERLEREIAEWKANTPLFEMLATNTDTQLKILDRLAHHNGSFKHVEESLGDVREGLRMLTGFIAGVVDVSAKEPRT